MEEILTPEFINMITTALAGGFTAFHGVKIGLFVFGKFVERRKAKQQAEEEAENTRERRRLGRLLEVVSGVVGALNQPPKVDEPSESDSPDESSDDPAEPVALEEVVKKVIEAINNTKK